jgi:hypothetical protein
MKILTMLKKIKKVKFVKLYIKYFIIKYFLIGFPSDRKISNSVDFQNSSQFKNKLIMKSDENNHNNINSNNKNNYNNNNNNNFNRNLEKENEKKMKKFIEGELANSLIKDNISYPLSPQNQKSNILKNYVINYLFYLFF